MCGRRWFCRRRALLLTWCAGVTLSVLLWRRSWEERQVQPSRYAHVPGAYLNARRWSNESGCRWRYGLPERLEYDARADVARSPESAVARVLYRVIEATAAHGVTGNGSAAGTGDVTLCTHATADLVVYASELLARWSGAVSLCVWTPGEDAALATRELVRLCRCAATRAVARLAVHWAWPPDDPPRLGAGDEGGGTCASASTVRREETRRWRSGRPYPVNVCRNVARAGAPASAPQLVSDVELMPSRGLATALRGTLRRRPRRAVDTSERRLVYALPVWEVSESVSRPPEDKEELARLVTDERAHYFHRAVCSHCQRFPGVERWLRRRRPWRSAPRTHACRAWTLARRERPALHRWEPVYVGSGGEPWYGEVLTWEGRQDKMSQLVEMCLQGYAFLVLDDCFLAHWPGVKRRTATGAAAKGSPYDALHRAHNQLRYEGIMRRLAAEYPPNDKC